VESEKTLSNNITPVAWAILAVVFIIIIVLAILAGLTAQQKSSAVQQKDVWDLAQQRLTAQQGNQRDLSSPSSRLAGHWEGRYYSPVDPELKIGTYRLIMSDGRVGPPIRFRVISEQSSENHLVIREYAYDPQIEALGLDTSKSDIECCISKDGQLMTRDYVFMGHRMFTVTHYIDDKTAP
jgi:hypothetical protein